MPDAMPRPGQRGIAVKPVDVAYVTGAVLLVAYIVWSSLANFSLGEWLMRCL